MKKLVTTLLLSLLFGNILQAQVVTGFVKDAKTRQPLPFVNVGIVGKSVGTVTNDAGGFKINTANHSGDTLRISMIGYKAASFLVADVVKNADNFAVNLEPDVVALKEVKVSNRKWKTAVLGNTTKSQSMTASFRNDVLGHEIGTIIKTKKKQTWLKKFNASLGRPASSDSVKVRLNIYEVVDNRPGRNILQQNIFTMVRKGDTSVDIDLTPYNIMVDGDKFFAMLEWIQTVKGTPISLSANLFRGGFWVRSTSAATFTHIGTVSLGFNVTAEY